MGFMGQNPNRLAPNKTCDSIPTKIGSKMGGAPTPIPKWDPIGFHSQITKDGRG